MLKYLLECLSESEEGDQPDSSDSTAAAHSLSKRTAPLHPIDNRFSLVASKHNVIVSNLNNNIIIPMSSNL